MPAIGPRLQGSMCLRGRSTCHVMHAIAEAGFGSQDNARDLSHAEWLALLLDREAARRDTSRFQSRLRSAKLRHSQASIEDVDYRAARRLDKAMFQQLATGRWIAEHRNVLVTGKCGVGKSWLSCALAQKAGPATGITAGGLAPSGTGGCGYLPRSRTGMAPGQCRSREPRPAEGDDSDRALPHGGARRARHALRERGLRLHGHRLQ
jgi:hypothetical protein